MEGWTQYERGGNGMRRQLYFDYLPTENCYLIQEGESNIFRIDGSNLKFVSLEFYNGVYAGNKSTAIDFENKIADTSSDILKKGRYIFDWIKEMFKAIEEELPDPEKAEDQDNEQNDNEFGLIDETQSDSESKKIIPLFDWPTCAGDGFYFDQANVPFDWFGADNPNADYAVKISGRSMEPTIEDGSIVMVKQVDVLSNGDIGIFRIGGEIMCKRYCIDDAGIILRPDNQSGNFCDIDVSKVECAIQGKVLLE